MQLCYAMLVWQVNEVLDISFKTFIRMVACFPEKVSNVIFQSSMTGLEPSEKVSVCVCGEGEWGESEGEGEERVDRGSRVGGVERMKNLKCVKWCLPPQVHVNIIVVEARMQAELIYAMRALMRFMKS